jgi:hypothetical protein
MTNVFPQDSVLLSAMRPIRPERSAELTPKAHGRRQVGWSDQFHHGKVSDYEMIVASRSTKLLKNSFVKRRANASIHHGNPSPHP